MAGLLHEAPWTPSPQLRSSLTISLWDSHAHPAAADANMPFFSLDPKLRMTELAAPGTFAGMCV